MEKKLIGLAAETAARQVWRFGKITSGPLRILVFWGIQTLLVLAARGFRQWWTKRRGIAKPVR